MELGPLPGKRLDQNLRWLKPELFTWFSQLITYNYAW